jgi:hypothetical protein
MGSHVYWEKHIIMRCCVAALRSGPLNFELADLHGPIKEIGVTSKNVTSEP